MIRRARRSRWLCLGLLAAVVASTSNTGFAVSALTDPVGVVKRVLPLELSGLGVPLIEEEVLVGEVRANTGSLIELAQAGIDVGALLTSGQPYFVEVLSGELEGERMDVDTLPTQNVAPDSAIVLNLASSRNTVSVVPDNALANARVSIRRHLTLARLQALFQPSLHGNFNLSLADQVFLLEGGAWRRFTLFIDNGTWTKAGQPGDFRNQVIPPGAGILIRLGTQAKSLIQTGKVRVNAFRLNLYGGYQSFASPYPADMTPFEIGAFVDTDLPEPRRWFTTFDLDEADSIYPMESGAFVRFTLFIDGMTWTRAGSPGSFTHEKILGSTNAALFKRTNPDHSYAILPPFSL